MRLVRALAVSFTFAVQWQLALGTEESVSYVEYKGQKDNLKFPGYGYFLVNQLIDEPTYSFRSSDNPRAYPLEQNLSTQARPTVIHGVLVGGESVAVVASDDGASGVHEYSAVFVKNSLYIAVEVVRRPASKLCVVRAYHRG